MNATTLPLAGRLANDHLVAVQPNILSETALIIMILLLRMRMGFDLDGNPVPAFGEQILTSGVMFTHLFGRVGDPEVIQVREKRQNRGCGRNELVACFAASDIDA